MALLDSLFVRRVRSVAPAVLRHPGMVLGLALDQAGAYRRYRDARCGHRTRLFGWLSAYGDDGTDWMQLGDKQPRWCIDCINALAIPCAWCGGSIYPGDPVTLYSPRDPDYQPKHEGAVRYLEDPVTYVGCLRFICAETGADRAGFWHPPQGVYRHPSALELILANPGKGVIMNDVTDPRSAPVLFDLDLPHITDAHN
ncbi:MAG: hypothetical protein E6R05_06160 [Candidatus Moraniibacteriota bacterium]|nr:MAG: hypothetical protein E6R05_06160 [Candidatus Moranbacteria bacterium]